MQRTQREAEPKPAIPLCVKRAGLFGSAYCKKGDIIEVDDVKRAKLLVKRGDCAYPSDDEAKPKRQRKKTTKKTGKKTDDKTPPAETDETDAGDESETETEPAKNSPKTPPTPKTN